MKTILLLILTFSSFNIYAASELSAEVSYVDKSVKTCRVLKISEAKEQNLHSHCSNHSRYCALVFQYDGVVASTSGFNFSKLANWCERKTYTEVANINTADSCSSKVAGLQSIVNLCVDTYIDGNCFKTNWSKYKAEHPKCVYDALPVCIEACKSYYRGSHCTNVCQ